MFGIYFGQKVRGKCSGKCLGYGYIFGQKFGANVWGYFFGQKFGANVWDMDIFWGYSWQKVRDKSLGYILD